MNLCDETMESDAQIHRKCSVCASFGVWELEERLVERMLLRAQHIVATTPNLCFQCFACLHT